MEFGSLGGPSVTIHNDRNKTVEVTTLPDQGNLAPAYPPAAARRQERGTVALWLYVAADGFVDRVKVVKSSGYPLLDQAAVSRLRTWHFTPATRGGMPVSSIYKIAVTFGP
ncbi:MAG: energy transducer TonB [Rhodospirillales bacterium]|nr:energy transducer TonB [Rhodospirillales bacterium]